MHAIPQQHGPAATVVAMVMMVVMRIVRVVFVFMRMAVCMRVVVPMLMSVVP